MKILKAGRIVFFLTALIFVVMTVSLVYSSAATEPFSITIDGKTVTCDAAPEIVSGRVLVPASTIVSGLGGTSSWDQDSMIATFKRGSDTVKVTIGSKRALVNGTAKTLDVAAQLVTVDSRGGARTMVPLRFIGESFGFDVDWNNDTRTVIVTSPASEEPDPAPAVPSASITVSKTEIRTGQTLSGDTANTYTSVVVTATESLKAGDPKGVSLSGPYRYYVDLKDCKLGADTGTKTCTESSSQISSVRAGVPEANTVRVVVDLKVSIKPVMSFSSDGKTMTLSFKETAAQTEEPEKPSEGNSNTGTGNEGSTGTAPVVTAPDSLTSNNTVKHDSLADYDPYSDGKIVVCIDPGHESATGGKRSPDSTLLEWEFNRDVAYRLKALLEKQGYEVIMTVPKDFVSSGSKEEYTLAKRVETANSKGDVDLFVSIHGNANGSGASWDSASGWEIWIHKSGGASEKAAKCIEAATVSQIPEFRDRGIKKTAAGQIGLYVSRNTEMPSVLIEHGFYTNYNECQLMKNSDFRQRLAQADATGIINFFNSFR